VDGTGSGSCPVADFGISGAGPSRSATTVLVLKQEIIKVYSTHLTDAFER
jgi:hypothetical protein